MSLRLPVFSFRIDVIILYFIEWLLIGWLFFAFVASFFFAFDASSFIFANMHVTSVSQSSIFFRFFNDLMFLHLLFCCVISIFVLV